MPLKDLFNCHVKPSFGVYYVATGKQFLNEAIASANVSKKYNPDLSFAVCTDEISLAKQSSLFNRVVPHPNPRYSYRDKIAGMSNLPFHYTLFLDTDACIITDIQHLLSFSSCFDVSACYAPVRHANNQFPPDLSSVPHSFAELNSGVLLFKRNRRVRRLIHSWLRLYDFLFDQYGQLWDQASLRESLWPFISSNKLNLGILPNEYNLRLTKPWIAGKGMPVSIIHGRLDQSEYQPLINYLNSNNDRFRTCYEWFALYPNSSIELKLPPNPSSL
jgi:hypothetical protein